MNRVSLQRSVDEEDEKYDFLQFSFGFGLNKSGEVLPTEQFTSNGY